MPTLMVGLILSFVTMLSVLSVPLMVAGSQPTMLTVDMAFRINAYGDYPVANALGVISYLMTAIVAWFYLRYAVRERGVGMTRTLAGTTLKVTLLVLLAFAIIGPLANLVLWSFAERWYFPVQAAGDLGRALLGGRVPPDRRRDGLARDLDLDRAPDRRGRARGVDPGRLCAGAAAPAVPRADHDRVPAAAGVSRRRDLHQRGAHLLRARASPARSPAS